MKKAVSCTLLVCLTIICLMMQPFHVYAASEPISGFDYTNYYELSHVRFSGSQILNTGINLANYSSYDLEMDISFDTTYSGSYNGVFYGNSSDPTKFQCWINKTENTLNMRVNTNKFYSKTLSDTYGTISLSRSNGVVTFSYGQGNSIQTATANFSSNYNSALRIGTSGNDPYLYASIFKIDVTYGSDHALFIPAKRKSDDKVGFYNVENSTFYTSTTNTDFIPGAVIEHDPVVQQYTISTAVSPSGSGTVSGGGTYDSGTVISLVATASSGYSFSQWSDGNTSNPRSVEVTQNETYTAVFTANETPAVQYTITTAVSPSGSGSVSGGGTYDEGTVVSLSAAANNGYVFANWSDNSTQNPRSITVSQNATYTAIFTEESVTPDPPTPPAGWTDWTDSDDSEYLEDITSDIDLNKIYWSLYRKRVIDSINVYGAQLDVVSSVNGSNLNHVYFTGSYYDNTITALTGCNSTSYNYSTSSSNQVDVLTIEPAIYGNFDAPTIGEDGTVFNFGISVNGGTSSNVTTSTNGFSNTTEACRLIGMGQGDGSVDGTTLLELGYTKKTITYNDGSANGHTATVYVPGDENFEFSADMSFLDDLLEGLYINIVNNGKAFYHDEYELSIHGQDGYLMPEYGSVSSKAFIGNMFNFNGSGFDLYQNISTKFNMDPDESTYAYFNNQFSSHLTDNVYDRNYVYLYWQGNRNPKWRFKTDLTQSSIGLTNVNFNDVYVYNSYGSKLGIGDSLTITSSNVGDSGLTLGTLLYVNIDSVKFYQYKNNSLLNRFNQLGSMMYGWFNRIYQAIGNITGGNESNEIINNVVNDYDVDVEVNFNGLLSDVFTKKQDIDLNDPEYVVPSVDHSAIHSLAEAMEKIYDEVYIQNGIGIVIFAPLILLVLRLIL